MSISKNNQHFEDGLERQEEGASERASTLGETIRRQLADEIMSGSFGIDQRLDENLLAERFGVSRTPIREAIRQLAASGLVRINPRRSAVVAPLNPDLIGKAFEAAAEVEALVAGWAAGRASLMDIASLEDRDTLCESTADSGDMSEFADANRRFHDRIAELAGNESLAEAARFVRVRIAPFQRFLFQFQDERRLACAEHHAIVLAISQRDVAAAQVAMRRHILRVGIHALRRATRVQGDTSALLQGEKA